MGLFVKTRPIPPPGPKLVMESHFTRAAGFRGFKRFRVTVHGVTDAEQNSVKMRNDDLTGAAIDFKVFLDEHKTEYANVYINGNRVGIVWDPDEIYAIKNHLFSDVYAMFEDETVLGNKCTITRPRVRLFVKYVEQATK